MNYVQFHVGDWDSSTRLLSPLEKGVYIDLLMLYYSVERPLMRSECERISRAYAPEEKDALEYVLDRFFHREGDVYAHHRCDEEIAKAAEKSEKAAKSAKARWNKGSKAKAIPIADADDMQNGCTCNADADANGMRTHSERNAGAMLTKNQEPRTNINKKEEDACVCAGMGKEDNAFRLESPEADEKAQASKRKTPEAVTHLFDLPDLPDDWREYCCEVRPDLDPDRMFAEFKFYWQKGNGKGKLRSDKGWAQSWQNWIRSDKSKPAPATFVNRRPQTSSLPVPDCNEIDYHRGINPDGSF